MPITYRQDPDVQQQFASLLDTTLHEEKIFIDDNYHIKEEYQNFDFE